MSEWTPERIARYRESTFGGLDQELARRALAEIERLQAACSEYRAELKEQDATITRLQARVAELFDEVKEQAMVLFTRRSEMSELEERDQRREQLLREPSEADIERMARAMAAARFDQLTPMWFADSERKRFIEDSWSSFEDEARAAHRAVVEPAD